MRTTAVRIYLFSPVISLSCLLNKLIWQFSSKFHRYKEDTLFLQTAIFDLSWLFLLEITYSQSILKSIDFLWKKLHVKPIAPDCRIIRRHDVLTSKRRFKSEFNSEVNGMQSPPTCNAIKYNYYRTAIFIATENVLAF